MNTPEIMRARILASHVMPFVLVGAFTAAPTSIANAQSGGGSIGMGSMQMEAKIDEESEQLMVDAANRRVRMSPSHERITKESKAVTIEIHNPTKDALIVDLFLSDTIVPMSRYVSRETKTATQTAKSGDNTLLSDDPADSISSLFRPMSSWVRGLEKTVSLAPGERKSITVNIDIPDNPLKGEYATWVIGEVRPRKTLAEAKQVVYTTSNTKITYDVEQNNGNAKSAQ